MSTRLNTFTLACDLTPTSPHLHYSLDVLHTPSTPDIILDSKRVNNDNDSKMIKYIIHEWIYGLIQGEEVK